MKSERAEAPIHGNKTIKTLWLFDAHFPNTINIKPTLEFIKRFQPDILGFGGDFWDLDIVSHWNYEQYKNWGMDQVIRQFSYQADIFRAFMEQFISVCTKKTKFVYLIGNHELWLEDFCRKFPQIKQPSISNVLEGLPIEIIPHNQFYHIGKLSFVHGDIWGGVLNPAKRAVEKAKQTVVFGHFHTYMAFPDASLIEDTNKYLGICVPGLTPRDPNYGRGQPNRWLCGFFTATVRPSGNFSHHVQLVSPQNGSFMSQMGELYE